MKFNPEMTQAIKDGRKTQTRRPVKSDWAIRNSTDIRWLEQNDSPEVYGAGGVWKSLISPYKIGDTFAVANTEYAITSIRVERLQDISEADAKAEGVDGGCCSCGESSYPNPCGCNNPNPLYLEGVYWLWHSIYSDTEYKWDNNPHVWVYEFEVTK